MSRRLWTEEEDAALKALVAIGTTTTSIATALGRPESSIFSRTKLLAVQAVPRAACPTKAPSAPKAPVRRLRPCMCCRREFLSDGPHNRLCCTCRSKEKTPFDF